MRSAESKSTFAKQENILVYSIPIAAGILLRMIFLFYSLEFLDDRVEISSPVSRFKNIQEGKFLWMAGLNPYEGGVLKQSPLILLLFSVLQNKMAIGMVFIICDYVIAVCITKLAGWRIDRVRDEDIWHHSSVLDKDAEVDNSTFTGELDVEEDKACIPSVPNQPWKDPLENEDLIPKNDPTKPIDIPISPADIGSMYLLNPMSIIACAANSTQIFSSLSMALALYFAMGGKRRASMFALSLGTALSIYPVVLVGPCVLLLSHFNDKTGVNENATSCILKCFAGLALYTSGWIGLSFILMGNWSFFGAVYGTIIMCTDLRPNIGLFWYFYMEVFEQFRTFFLTVFHINIFVFTIPICMKFRSQPLLAAMIICASISLFKSYPTVADPPIYLALLSMHFELFKWSPHMFLGFTGMIYSSFLGPLFFNSWVWQGAGNANFFYAIVLVWAVSQIILVVDVAFAHLKRDWERQHPGWRRMRVELLYQYLATD